MGRLASRAAFFLPKFGLSGIVFCMVVRMRHTRAHTANRRSHHALKGMRFSKCSDCGAQVMSHTACSSCGKYRGKQVIDIAGQAAKQAAKAKKRTTQATGAAK